MKTRFVRFICFVMLLSVAALCFAPAVAASPFRSPRGSCDFIGGTTVVVTIFVDDPYNNWDFSRSSDKTSYFRVLSRLETACNWLSGQVSRYGASAKIYWDWHNLKHMYYWFASGKKMRDYENTYTELQRFITDNIPLQTIRDYYNADNVLFMALYNQSKSDTNGGVSFPLDFYAYANADDAYEILWVMDEDNGRSVSAAGLAHEIMHCFGAVDLYAASEYVTRQYADHLNSIRSNDIMFRIDYSDPDHIGESFSELDAYYMGLSSYSADRQKYGLSRSSFAK